MPRVQRFAVIVASPGYMPDQPPTVCRRWAEAQAALALELEETCKTLDPECVHVSPDDLRAMVAEVMATQHDGKPHAWQVLGLVHEVVTIM